jgi:hypothetical protein
MRECEVLIFYIGLQLNYTEKSKVEFIYAEACF